MTDPAEALPALLGGPPVRPQGPPEWPVPDPDVRHALEAAYADGSWGQYHGGSVPLLEERLAAYHGVPFALTCGSGTFAVELALRALKVGPGDEVALAAYDYPGNFLNVHAVGAHPLLVDLEPSGWQLSLERLAAAVGPATRAVIASHLHGGLVPMRELTALAAARGLRVIEDAAQCPGAVVQGKRAGAWGDIGVLSFGGSKLLSAGRGGAFLTPHADVHQRARLALHRGNHVCPLSELQAAALLPQLDKLDARNAHRLRSVRLLGVRLRDVPGLRPFAGQPPDCEPGYYKVGFQFDGAAFGLGRERFVTALRAEGIAFDEGFRGLHAGRSPSRFRRGGDLAEADRAHHGTVVLHHPVLLEGEGAIEEVITAVRKIHTHARRLALPVERTASPGIEGTRP
jgi:dTDP-4-amino-4,6-dideoxygalactose transaminase